MEGFEKGFSEPFQARGWRSILEGNHDHSPADYGVAVQSLAGGGSVLGAKRRAKKQRDQRDESEDSGAFHDKLIISASAAAAWELLLLRPGCWWRVERPRRGGRARRPSLHRSLGSESSRGVRRCR